MHAKMYLFKTADKYDIIIGSSNLTKSGILENIEINIHSQITANEYDKIMEYMNSVKQYSIDMNLEDRIENMKKNSVKARLYDEMNEFFPDIKQKNINDWEKEISQFQSDLHESMQKVLDDEWDTSEFKQNYLMSENWAITESKHTELWANVKKHNPDVIFKKLLEMIDNAKKEGLSIDDVLNSGRIPNVQGVSVLSEILHKYFIERFPIKNTRSSWGLLLIYDIGSSPEYILSEVDYTKFTEYCDDLYVYFKEWFVDKKLKLNDKFKYFYLDRLFLIIFESDKYSEIIKIYRQGKHDY